MASNIAASVLVKKSGTKPEPSVENEILFQEEEQDEYFIEDE